MMHVAEVLKELASTASKNTKLATLNRADSPALRKALLYALDPFRRYNVRKLDQGEDKIRGARLPLATMRDAYELLDDLAARRVTGNSARVQVREMLALLTPEDGEVFKRVLLKDLRCGVNRKIANDVFPGLVPEFSLQGARHYDPKRATWPLWGEPKIDGMRVVAVVQKSGEVEYLSRGGRPVKTFAHCSPVLARALAGEGGVLDCEASLDGAEFESSMSAIKRGAPKSGAVPTLYAFDHLTLAEWRARACKRPLRRRRGELNRIFSLVGDHKNVRVLQYVEVDSVSKAQWYYGQCRRGGYEGAILKEPEGLYEFKHTDAWLKMKPSDNIDVEITGVKEGKGKYVGQVGALLFQHNDVECSTSGMSDAQRVEFWRWHKRPGKRPPLVGHTMEVEFTETTAKGRTRHARFVRLREHDGERD